MNKNELISYLNEVDLKETHVELIYFQKYKRNKNFDIEKISFKKDEHGQSYLLSLINCIVYNQLEPLESIENYTGDNLKVTCDKIPLINTMIEESWKNFLNDIEMSDDNKIKGKINGYMVICKDNKSNADFGFCKFSNPKIAKKNKKSAVYKLSSHDELTEFNEDIEKLYLNCDFLWVHDNLYTFNLKIENIFPLHQSLETVKAKVIDKVSQKYSNVFSNENFIEMLQKTKALKTFNNFSFERLNLLSITSSKLEIITDFQIKINEEQQLVIEDDSDYKNLMLFLTSKIDCCKYNKTVMRVTPYDKFKKADDVSES